jgi:predicted ATPase
MRETWSEPAAPSKRGFHSHEDYAHAMWIRQLQIENFRGIRKATAEFSEQQTVLVGANGAGKSTIIEALALIFGRDRLVHPAVSTTTE